MPFYPRVCMQCGKGMDEGYLLHDSDTLCSRDCLVEYLYRYELAFYTAWEEIDDTIVYDENGVEHKIIKTGEQK